jgi:hypothetical protein
MVHASAMLDFIRMDSFACQLAEMASFMVRNAMMAIQLMGMDALPIVLSSVITIA